MDTSVGTTVPRAPLRVRKVQFAYPDDLAAHWNPARPEWSQVVNASSLLMPYLEPFLIDAVREALPLIDDPPLRDEAKAYLGQEAHHFKQHRRFNDLLLARGYAALRGYEETLAEDYARLRRRPLAFRLAYAAGFETMALAIGHMLVRHRTFFFQDADASVSSLVLWHFVEEIEHKRAAFDVYQHVVGSYPQRIRGLVYAMWHTLRRTRHAYVLLLQRDGLWGRWRTRVALKRLLARIAAACGPRILESVSPWHDPARVPDPAWMREWVDLYERGEEGLTRLDTRHMQRTPAELVG
jgi:predicted metal-dependent hydrolase